MQSYMSLKVHNGALQRSSQIQMSSSASAILSPCIRPSTVPSFKTLFYTRSILSSHGITNQHHLYRFCSTSSTKKPTFQYGDTSEKRNDYQKWLRNIGISAHIDSGKTTLTERILYYTGRIKEMHEVKGKDGVGATMDFMELERERGITIQSAATYCSWGDYHINIIDTPGHVDFTIEVERALRVLDAAILVLCGVSGVQSQTITVDRQMKRYKVPRLAFINKLDRLGADPWKSVDGVRNKLQLNAAAMQVPIGLEAHHRGVVDLLTKVCHYFEGDAGDHMYQSTEIPAELQDTVRKKRVELIERIADADDKIMEKMMDGVEPSEEELKAAVRRATIARKFVPMFMGSAYKNKGVQLLLDGVIDYLPNPMECDNYALDTTKNEEKVILESDSAKPFVGLAFKLEESQFGQLTYIRIYQGALQRGEFIQNLNTDRKVKIPRLVRMHARMMEDVQAIGAGEICAMFGVDCHTGHSFCGSPLRYVLTSMHVPDPVVSLAVSMKRKDQSMHFSKALQRFQKEDPTFKVHYEKESGETIVSGMGELHLEIYLERMFREYGVETKIGKPQVAYRETITGKETYHYTHKKQTGGAGQYARVIGYVEPMPYVDDKERAVEFINATVGQNIPPEFIPACKKGFEDAIEKGPLVGAKVVGCRMVLQDGLSHSVDSNEFSFRTATAAAFRQAFLNAGPSLLEPVMTLEVVVPTETQANIIASITKRGGMIDSSEGLDAENVRVNAEVPLNNMFGFSTDLRSMTQGKGEFAMEFNRYAPVQPQDMEQVVQQFRAKEAAKKKDAI